MVICIFSREKMFRVGLGYDIHRTIKNRKLILGGVEIPHIYGLDGHSDADVVLHAIADALLGAAGLPDIGHHFPNTDEKHRDADSRILLKEVVDIIQKDYTIINIDTMLICEQPKISPYIGTMKKNIREITGCSAVNVKATTSEGMNDEGSGKCISAQAICLLQIKKI